MHSRSLGPSEPRFMGKTHIDTNDAYLVNMANTVTAGLHEAHLELQIHVPKWKSILTITIEGHL